MIVGIDRIMIGQQEMPEEGSMDEKEYSLKEITPCSVHRCRAPCCEIYEVKLLESDIARIEESGLDRGGFCEYFGNDIYLRRNEGGCLFLVDSICTIHPVRPFSCRTFPWIIRNEQIVTDDFCPFHDEFKLDELYDHELHGLLVQFRIEAKARNICLKNSCCECCKDTEMPLTEADIIRISGLGYVDFSVEDDGDVLLRNIDRRCYFLDPVGNCTIYENRPEGCGFYPFILGKEGAVLDEDCPHREKFVKRFSSGMELDLMELVERLKSENRLG